MDLSFRNVIRSGPVNELDRLKFVWSLVAWLSLTELSTSVREKLEASQQISNRALERVPVLVLFL
jgi:hypothetical protein